MVTLIYIIKKSIHRDFFTSPQNSGLLFQRFWRWGAQRRSRQRFEEALEISRRSKGVRVRHVVAVDEVGCTLFVWCLWQSVNIKRASDSIVIFAIDFRVLKKILTDLYSCHGLEPFSWCEATVQCGGISELRIQYPGTTLPTFQIPKSALPETIIASEKEGFGRFPCWILVLLSASFISGWILITGLTWDPRQSPRFRFLKAW